jgi:uncharacterized membrane protein
MNAEKPRSRRVLLILSLLGLADALYLTWIKLFPTSPFCFGLGNCEVVNTSVYSEIHGIPIAIFGALAYVALVTCLLLETRLAWLREWGPAIEFAISLAGTLYSAYLTYIEIAVLHKICPYCVVSAILMTAICVISGLRFQNGLKDLPD